MFTIEEIDSIIFGDDSAKMSNRKSIFVTLTDDQLRWAKAIGDQRHNAKDPSFRNTSIFMKGLNGEDEYSMPHKVGILGEIAYAIISGYELDKNIYRVRDGGIDFGDIAEVKTITYMGNDPELKIKIHEFSDPKRCPRKYILARYNKDNSNIVELIGEISREDFDKNKIVKRYNGQNHDNYVVGIKHLSTVVSSR